MPGDKDLRLTQVDVLSRAADVDVPEDEERDARRSVSDDLQGEGPYHDAQADDVARRLAPETARLEAPFVRISDIYTANPTEIWRPKSSFGFFEPFAIVLVVSVSGDLIESGSRSNTVFQLVNPRLDPAGSNWYYSGVGGDPLGTIQCNSRDHFWDNVTFPSATYFFRYMAFSRYADAVAAPPGLRLHHARYGRTGVFFVRGTIDVIDSDHFAHSGEYWYKTRDLAGTTPGDIVGPGDVPAGFF